MSTITTDEIIARQELRVAAAQRTCWTIVTIICMVLLAKLVLDSAVWTALVVMSLGCGASARNVLKAHDRHKAARTYLGV